MGGVTRIEDIPQVIERLREMYDESVANLRNALARYLKSGDRPDPAARAAGLFAYPELRIDYRYDPSETIPRAPFGRLNQPGLYATSIARPDLFRDYLIEQLDLSDRGLRRRDLGRPLGQRDPLSLCARRHRRPAGSTAPRRADLALWFPTTELAHIGDEIADGAWMQPPGDAAAAGAVRRPAHRFQPGPAAPLHRHAGRARPALSSCSPTISATSTSSSAGRSTSCSASPTAPIAACPRPAASTSPRTRRTRSSR